MNILIIDLDAERREKKRHLQTLVPLLAAHPDVRLLLAGPENSTLAELAKAHKLEAVICKNGRWGSLVSDLKFRWRLRKPDTPWLMQCCGQKSLILAMRLAAKKKHLGIIYSALRPEPVTDRRIAENIGLIDAVIADTRHISDIMVSYCLPQARISVIPGCIDASAYPARRPRGENRIIFACSDTLEEERGYDQLLQGLACLYGCKDMPAWELRIIGGGPMFEDFLDKAVSLRVDSRLAIFGGLDVQAMIRDCDIMVAPADRNDGGSLSIKEGWATGLPIICSDLSSNRELVTDGKNGLFFQNGDPADLADKMCLLAQKPDLREALAGAGRAALGDYSCEAMLRKHLALYKKILDARAKPAPMS